MAITKEITIAVKETGLDQVNKKVNKLEKSVESLEAEQRSLASSMGESSNAVLENGGAMGLLNDATGGLAMTVKDAVEASWLFTKSQKAQAIQQAIATTVVGTSTGAMKAFRIALASTGVGAIVIGLVMLIANFDKVKKAVLNLIPGLASVGEWFGKIFEDITDFIGITSEAERALERFDKASEKRSAELDRKLAERGSLYSESAKKKMAIDAKLEEDLRKHIYNEVELRKEAQRQKDLIDKENAKKEADKRKQEREKIEQEQQKAKEDELRRAKEFEDKKNKFIDESYSVLADSRAMIANKEKKEQELKDEEELKRKQKEKDAMLADLEQKVLIRDLDVEAERRAEEAKAEIRQIGLDNLGSIGQSLQALAGKNKAIAKAGLIIENATSIAKIVQNTLVANAKAVAAFPLTAGQPFVGLNIVSGALGVAASIKATATAMKDLGGGSPSGAGSGFGSAPQAPSFNLVQGTGQNQIAQSITSQSPVKAYVVSRDMSTAQETDRNIIKSASI